MPISMAGMNNLVEQFECNVQRESFLPRKTDGRTRLITEIHRIDMRSPARSLEFTILGEIFANVTVFESCH